MRLPVLWQLPTVLLVFGIAFCLLTEPAIGLTQQTDPTRNPVNVDTQQQMQVLAVVNGEQITRQQIATQCLRRFGQEVLESIVNKQLVFNECQRRGVVILEKDINDEISAKAKSFHFSNEHFIEIICTKRAITVDQYKNDIVWLELALRRLAANDIEVTAEEIEQQIEFEYGPKVQVREIALDSKEKAQQLLQLAQANPQEFGNLAKEHSMNPNSQAMKGLLPPIAKHSGAPELEKIVFAMKPGDISDVIQVGEGQFIIVQCERIFPGAELSQDQLVSLREEAVERISESKLADAASALFLRLQETVKVVNVMNDPELSKQFPGVAAKVDTMDITMRYLAEECIARFAMDTLETEVNRTILLQALKKAGQQVSQEDITAEINRAAESFGYVKADGQVDVDAWLKYTTNNDLSKVDLYVEDEVWPTVALKKLISDQVQVTEEDMQKGFEANFGPRVEVLAMVFKDHRQALRVWSMANANPTDEYFGKLANQYSVEPASQANFGQVPAIQKHGGRPELENEAFSLKVGEISKVTQVGEHYIIMLCQGHTTPMVDEFDSVKDTLRKDILEKKMRLASSDMYLRLKDDAQIDNFLAGTSQTSRMEREAAQKMESVNTQKR